MEKTALVILGANGFIGKELVASMQLEEQLLICLDLSYDKPITLSINQVLIQGDAAKSEDVNLIAEYCHKHGVKIQGLVNLIGVNDMKDIFQITGQEWDKTFQANVKAITFAIQQLYALFSNSISIINVASQNGVVGHEERIAYGPSKAALIQLTKNLSIDFLKDRSKDIKVNSVSPGYILNDSNREYLMGVSGRALLKKIPYRRFVECREVVDVIHFLLSEKSSAIRGQNIIIDYGYSMV